MLGRRQARQVGTRGEMMRQELGDSFDHLRQAAGHGAGGARVLATAGWDTTRAAMAPLVDAARTGAAEALRGIEKSRESVRQAQFGPYRTQEPFRTQEMVKSMGKMKRAATAGAKAARKEAQKSQRRRKMPVLLGILAAGAAVGTIGAIVARRRNKARWEEYDQQGHGSDGVAQTLGDADLAGTAATAAGKVSESTGEAVEYARRKAGELADEATSASHNGRS